MAEREALHVLARALSPPPGLGRPGVLAEHEALCEPSGDGAAAGRVLPASESARAGGLLPPDEGPVRDAEAITATAHKLARLIYRLLKHGTA
jgi:hypothetical protein